MSSLFEKAPANEVNIFYFLISVQFEADRRAFMITINSFGTELSKDDRVKLFPTCGKLYPEGLAMLAKADEYDQVKVVAEYYAVSLMNLLNLTDMNCLCLPWKFSCDHKRKHYAESTFSTVDIRVKNTR